jgi:FlaG/FlaF family flagellin (archaellin)
MSWLSVASKSISDPYWSASCYGRTKPVGIGALFFSAVLVAPVAEELLFRGLFLGFVLDREYGPVIAGGSSLLVFDQINQPAPIVGQSSGELVPQAGNTDGIIRITHVAGDTIQMSNVEVVVDASDACREQGRLVDLPVPSGGNNIDQSNIEGADIFDQRGYGSDGVPGPNAIHKAEYAPGDEIAFRITGGPCPITQGDEITVRVVHTQTSSVIIEETLTAT